MIHFIIFLFQLTIFILILNDLVHLPSLARDTDLLLSSIDERVRAAWLLFVRDCLNRDNEKVLEEILQEEFETRRGDYRRIQ
jgi:hypothetical protein